MCLLTFHLLYTPIVEVRLEYGVGKINPHKKRLRKLALSRRHGSRESMAQHDWARFVTASQTIDRVKYAGGV